MQYGFKSRFVLPIELGTKKQTIRAPRKGRSRHAITGDMLQLTTGDRFHPRRIGLARCLFCLPITLRLDVDTVDLVHPGGQETLRFGMHLTRFAILDGFQSWEDLKAFWADTHPEATTFDGFRIFWGDTFAGPLDPPPAELSAGSLPQEK